MSSVDNTKICKIFREMADLLALKDENPFRIRAYEKAADTVEHLSGNVGDLYHQGKLKEIPGIGKGMLEKIETILKTGTLPAYEELKSQFPPDLLELLSIPDLGPKTVKLLHEKVGVENIEDLEAAVRERKLRDLPGMGAKKEQNILRGIKLYKTQTSRILLGRALPLVEEVISELTEKSSSLIEKISPAGSLRRGKETIGDIDILAISSDPRSLMDSFASLSFVEEVLAKGETKSSILTAQGLQMDLRIVPSDSFGAAIQYFTGSKSHNINLRERAVRRGLKINEYGVFTKGNKKIAGEEEAGVYGTLDLPFIPPELREDRGEIAAAEKGLLPTLVEEKDIKGDLHIHTNQTDGRDDIETIVEKARNRGYEYIAITDHSSSLKVAGGLSVKELSSQIQEIQEINSRYDDIEILAGTEVNIDQNGNLDFPDKLLAELDVVIAAIHTGFKQDEQTITERVIKAIRHPLVHIFAHPTGRLLGEREPYAINLEKVIKVAGEKKVWLEINSQPERLDLVDYWAMEAKKQGVKVAINTDAHSKESLDFIKLGVITARRGWLEKDDVVNTLPLDKFLHLLKSKRKR